MVSARHRRYFLFLRITITSMIYSSTVSPKNPKPIKLLEFARQFKRGSEFVSKRYVFSTDRRLTADSEGSVHVHYAPEGTNPEDFYKMVFGETARDLKVKHILMRDTYKLGNMIRLPDLDEVLQLDVSLDKYKYSKPLKRITFATTSDKQTSTFMISASGSIQIIASKPIGKNKLSVIRSIKYIKDLITAIPHVLGPKTGTRLKRPTTMRAVPGVKAKTPQVCIGHHRARPDPYNFTGKCKDPGYAPMDGGIHYSKARNKAAKKLNWYGPCCERITGRAPDAVHFTANDFPEKFLMPKRTADQIIARSTGKRKTFIETIVYGYSPDDPSAEAGTKYAGTSVVERRAYKGLIDLLATNKNQMIKKIVDCYVKSA
jgi:hypothetical protein